jgi:hypothetical protein
MIPFLHLGPITIPIFGLMVATALLVSAYVLQVDFLRHGRFHRNIHTGLPKHSTHFTVRLRRVRSRETAEKQIPHLQNAEGSG